MVNTEKTVMNLMEERDKLKEENSRLKRRCNFMQTEGISILVLKKN